MKFKTSVVAAVFIFCNLPRYAKVCCRGDGGESQAIFNKTKGWHSTKSLLNKWPKYGLFCLKCCTQTDVSTKTMSSMQTWLGLSSGYGFHGRCHAA